MIILKRQQRYAGDRRHLYNRKQFKIGETSPFVEVTATTKL